MYISDIQTILRLKTDIFENKVFNKKNIEIELKYAITFWFIL